MNWRIILLLSLFGLAMAFATISWIPFKFEPACWLLIFFFCAYTIAKNVPGRYFLHGFLLSIINSVWITAVHVMFYESYMAHHAEMVQMSANMPLQDNPQLMMIIMGPVFGAASGLVLGLFSYIAGKAFQKAPAASSDAPGQQPAD